MMQGDAYGLPIEILRNDETVVTPNDVSDVEIAIGFLTKTYKAGEITYNANAAKWVFPLTQEETFRFPAVRMKAQVRVVWPDGSVEGVCMEGINVHESISKEVL